MYERNQSLRGYCEQRGESASHLATCPTLSSSKRDIAHADKCSVEGMSNSMYQMSIDTPTDSDRRSMHTVAHRFCMVSSCPCAPARTERGFWLAWVLPLYILGCVSKPGFQRKALLVPSSTTSLEFPLAITACSKLSWKWPARVWGVWMPKICRIPTRSTFLWTRPTCLLRSVEWYPVGTVGVCQPHWDCFNR